MKDARPKYEVDLEPIGRRAEIAPGQTLLDATRSAGVDLEALCGGEGWCHSCVVRLVRGDLNSPSLAERDALTPEQLASGFRLACQAVPLGDVKVDIPPESLTAQQRLSIEGQEVLIRPEPAVTRLDLDVPVPTLHDLRSDASRLCDGISAAGFAAPDLPLAVLQDLSGQLRRQGWHAGLAIRGPRPEVGAHRGELVAVLAPRAELFGLAVDIGTTKLAAYLVNLADGHTVAKAGAMNPQIGYGEDVVSRIAYCFEHRDGRSVLQATVIESLNALAAQLCAEAGAKSEQVVDAVVVGNTAMHHLFAGLPIDQLGQAPYVAAVSDPLDLRARDLGLKLAPGAYVHLPANVAGFVGADHVAMAAATGAWETPRTIVALDIGTNTEVTLARGGHFWCCSCASGPAFEGAHIKDGMRAAPGAIERIAISDGKPYLKTIGDRPPVGICGSGILDAVSELFRAGIINRKGMLDEGAPGVGRTDGVLEFTLAPGPATGHGKPLVITRKDINEIQLAKAAIRTGVDILLYESRCSFEDIEEFTIAGAFGTYLDVSSSVRIGMFPPLPLDRFHQVGNAAGAGARQMLVSLARREAAARLAPRAEYVELTVHPEFTHKYMKALYLD